MVAVPAAGEPAVVVDARWDGAHGIGRFAREVLARVPWQLVPVTGSHPVSARGLLELDPALRRAARRTGTRAFFTPGYAAPLAWPGRLALTVHDLIHLDVPGECSPAKTAYYRYAVRPAVRRADLVVTVSEFSRRRIVQWADIPPERVLVAGNGVDQAFFEADDDAGNGGYLLHVGNHRPHKNLPALLRALAAVADPPPLWLTGTPDPELGAAVARCRLTGVVRFLGHVPEADLPRLYRRAAAVVMPSTYEGFGLPALEGLAAGVPVVVSDRTALPEVVGEAGWLVDPEDPDAWAAAWSDALSDAGRARARQAGPARAREFSWARVAGRVAAAYPPGR